ncbi:hypothetical protein KAI87_10565 [Myxococcota bacterium]|nr:hypothetical protein [Myxococcota bacterium]
MATESKTDKHGNIFQDDPNQWRHRPDGKGKTPVAKTEASAEQNESMQAAAKTIETDSAASASHGAPVGAGNMLKLHQWRKDGLPDKK